MIQHFTTGGTLIEPGLRINQVPQLDRFTPTFTAVFVEANPPRWVCEARLGSVLLHTTEAFNDEYAATRAAHNELEGRVARLLSV